MNHKRAIQNALTIAIWLAAPFAARTASADPVMSIAAKGGANGSTQAEQYRVTRYGFSGGLSGSLEWLLRERFSLGGQLELLYTPRGSETVFEGESLGKVRRHYVDAMLAARPEVRLGRITTYLLLGAGVNLLMSAKGEDPLGGMEDVTDDSHRLDVSLLGGAGAAVHLPASELGPFHLGTVFLEARHDIGLRDVDAVNGGFKNRTSSLMLGLSFVLGAAPSAPASTAATTAAR